MGDKVSIEVPMDLAVGTALSEVLRRDKRPDPDVERMLLTGLVSAGWRYVPHHDLIVLKPGTPRRDPVSGEMVPTTDGTVLRGDLLRAIACCCLPTVLMATRCKETGREMPEQKLT